MHLIIDGILVSIKFSCCTSLMKLSIQCYFILLVRYVALNYIRGLAIILLLLLLPVVVVVIAVVVAPAAASP